MTDANAGGVPRPRSWLRSRTVWAVFLLLCVGGGVVAWMVWDPFGPYTPPGGRPTKKEMMELLTGQTIPSVGVPKLTLREIEAMEVNESEQTNKGGWITRVSFIAQAKEGRYAVVGYVTHRLIDDKRAFINFNIESLHKQ
jgi:hypothetical protein